MAPRRSARIAAESRPAPHVTSYASTPPPYASYVSTQPFTTTNATSSWNAHKGKTVEGKQILQAIQWLEEHTFNTFEEFLCAGEDTKTLVRSTIDRALGEEELMGLPFGKSAKEKYVGDWVIWILWDLAGRGNAEALDEVELIIRRHSSPNPTVDQTGSAKTNWVSGSAVIAAFTAAHGSEAPSAESSTFAAASTAQPRRGRLSKDESSKFAASSSPTKCVHPRKNASSKAATSLASILRVRQSKNASSKAATSSAATQRIRPTAMSAARSAALTSELDRGKFPMMRRKRASAKCKYTPL